MTDNELATWRREWLSQPAVPIDLIRKVERQTMYMKLERIALILPILIGVGTIIFASVITTIPTIVLALGTWAFILFGLRFQAKNDRGLWAPAAQTTAAYVDLSIARCRRELNAVRYFFVFAPLLSAFVMIALFVMLADLGAFKTTRDYLITAGAFVYSAIIVAMVGALMASKRKKTRTELDYLLDLQRKFGAAN